MEGRSPTPIPPYRDSICPLLGARPDNTSTKSGVGWDGNPLEYSFELRGSTKNKSVRFVVDLSELRPADKNNTLSMATTQKVVDALAEKTPGFDDTWYRVLKEWFVYSHLSPNEQEALIAKAGQQTSVILAYLLCRAMPPRRDGFTPVRLAGFSRKAGPPLRDGFPSTRAIYAFNQGQKFYIPG
ncbi:hypothetical protein VC83_08980 [Pseudogymnoascus destructans]|uniref:Uncharacterized protein n=1 Tax=Pseudogymnoascus destructans TaxID=655981 RepID=A0A176ZZD6_9PEZI|nr:uncharacterized protein VC83_08980 [Pseudogymnoascus destructans]OAF54690.1 hypothetical protein VC83_08980 [Pseudogymnoascus destructans]